MLYDSLFQGWEVLIGFIMLSGSALAWVIKTILEIKQQRGERQINKWLGQLEFYWPLQCKLQNLRILLAESDINKNDKLLSSPFAKKECIDTMNFISNEIQKAHPREELSYGLRDLMCALYSGYINNEPFRFVSYELIDRNVHMINIRTTFLGKRLREKTSTSTEYPVLYKNSTQDCYFDIEDPEIANKKKYEKISSVVLESIYPQTLVNRYKLLHENLVSKTRGVSFSTCSAPSSDNEDEIL